MEYIMHGKWVSKIHLLIRKIQFRKWKTALAFASGNNFIARRKQAAHKVKTKKTICTCDQYFHYLKIVKHFERK